MHSGQIWCALLSTCLSHREGIVDVGSGALQGVVNRDIKLENTLLDGSKRPLLKICDFGYSKNDKDSVPKSKVGTPGYTGEHDCLQYMFSLLACMLSMTHTTLTWSFVCSKTGVPGTSMSVLR